MACKTKKYGDDSKRQGSFILLPFLRDIWKFKDVKQENGKMGDVKKSYEQYFLKIKFPLTIRKYCTSLKNALLCAVICIQYVLKWIEFGAKIITFMR